MIEVSRASGAWDAKWTGDHYFGPKERRGRCLCLAFLLGLPKSLPPHRACQVSPHGRGPPRCRRACCEAPSLDRAGTVGFRCVADRH